MCGIIGYKGKKNAVEIVLKGLKKLEYRGYDSWGICSKNSNFQYMKRVGKIENVELKDLNLTPSHLAIGHTRWSTHGSVTETNAHPHFSNNKKIAVVHNGIIENYQDLKKFLGAKGFRFQSQTDTEVIPNLIEYFMKTGGSFKESFLLTLKKLEGSFSIVAIEENSESMMGARKNSPLVLGLDKDGVYIASDFSPFIESTKKSILLSDNEMVVIDSQIEVFNFNTGKPVKKKLFIMHWDYEQSKKGDYDHFMMKEIEEQSSTIRKAVQQDPKQMKKIVNEIKKAFGVFLVGCGTSYNACISASYVFSHIAKKHVNVVLASEFKNYEEFLTNKTLMIALSQSGETADLLEAVKIAKSKGVKVISITNVIGSTLTHMSDENIMMNCGPEICVLSTKSYTSQLGLLIMLAYGAANRLNEGKKLVIKSSKFVSKIIKENESKLKALSKKIKNHNSIFLIGRDLAYPSALEGALKIKEVSYIHAEGFAGGELKHGTIALIEEGVPVIVLTTEHTKKEILSNAMEVKSRGGYIIGINSSNNEIYDYFVHVPEAGMADPILSIIPIQMLAYYLAVEKGFDPDKPRNLAKSVTVK